MGIFRLQRHVEELRLYKKMESDLRAFDMDLLNMGGRIVDAQIGVSAVRLRISRILKDSSG